jgi:hypothetical protein
LPLFKVCDLERPEDVAGCEERVADVELDGSRNRRHLGSELAVWDLLKWVRRRGPRSRGTPSVGSMNEVRCTDYLALCDALTNVCELEHAEDVAGCEERVAGV